MPVKVALLVTEQSEGNIFHRQAEDVLDENEHAERVMSIPDAEIVTVVTRSGIESFIEDRHAHVQDEPALAREPVTNAIDEVRAA